MSGALSPTHWLIIVGVLVVLFGANKLPDAARGIGKSLRIFKTEIAASRDDQAAAGTSAPAVAPPTTLTGQAPTASRHTPQAPDRAPDTVPRFSTTEPTAAAADPERVPPHVPRTGAD